MKRAISQIKQLIKHHESERNRFLAFFREREQGSFVIEHTNQIYDELIGELNEAIRILQERDFE